MCAKRIRCFNGVADYGDELRYRTVRELIDSKLALERDFIRYYRQDSLETVVTFDQFAHAVISFARQLSSDYGIGSGDVVVVVAENSPVCLVAYSAILYLGGIVLPANPAENEEFLNFIHMDAHPLLWIADDGVELPSAAFERGALRLSDNLLDQRLTNPEIASFRAGLGGLEYDDKATIIYTSGTTGRSKGICHTQGNWLVNAEAARRLHDMDNGHVHMCVLPVFHVNAFGFSYIGCLYSEARLILNAGLNPMAYWQIVRQEQVTLCSMVPNVMQTLCKMARRGFAEPLSSVRYATCGAAPLSQDLVREFIDKFRMRVIQVYGMSEASNFNLTMQTDLSDADYETLMFGYDRTSAGCPVFGMELDIVGRDSASLPPGQRGEVVIRGWSVAAGYHNFPEGTAEVFRDDWLYSGDVGYYHWINEKKYFFLCGRLKDMAKRYSESISLIDIEERLKREPGLTDIVAVPFLNDPAGEEIGLFLVPGENTPDDERILDQMNAIFPTHRRPKVIIRGAAIPKTSTGKVKRSSLSPLFSEFEHVLFA